MMSVSTGPGEIEFAVTPKGPSSRATPRMRPTMPALAAAYAVFEYVPPPFCAVTEERPTMRPTPLAAMIRPNACVTR